VNTGAQTQVKLATDRRTGRSCAVKMAVKKPEMLAMFKQEVEVLSRSSLNMLLNVLSILMINGERCIVIDTNTISPSTCRAHIRCVGEYRDVFLGTRIISRW
jgi:serine/threonine protein kinase